MAESTGNNNQRNHKVMSKFIKFFALAGAALLLGACQEDLGLETGTITPGNEILFGANAYFENGEPQTRTEYGDIQGNRIEVLWVPGEDRMDIACPQAVGAPGHQAEYMVSELENDTTSGWNGDGVAGNDRASVLVRKSAVGLQWSTSRTHNFYAAYPSKNQIAEHAVGRLPQNQIDELGMTVSYDQETNAETATLRGFIPVDQSPAKENITGNATDGWVVEPDMTYAYMVANASHTYGAGSSVSLQFQPQVTALEFEIISSDFNTDNLNALYPNITILGVQLFSKSGQQMAGQFTYTYPLAGSGTGQFNTIQANGYEKITQTFGDGLKVTAADKPINVTFFMLPGVTFNSGNDGDLGLTVIYKIGDNPQVKTASLMKEITPKKKYFFKNVKLPAITENISGSTWFSALNPNTYVSQVSIPVAGNVFANTTYGAGIANAQQTLNYETLWNRGVRGFEFVTQTTGTEATDATLANEHFVCTENELPSTPTFATAFTTLVEHLSKNPSECLVFIMTYMPCDDGFRPERYVKQLINYLNSFVTNNTLGYTKDDFVILNNSTIVEDLQGKIAIIIRPGDDSRMEAKINGNYTEGIDLGDWANNLQIVYDWGASSYDVWDRRYGSGYARSGNFVDAKYYKYEKEVTVVRAEDQLQLFKENTTNASPGFTSTSDIPQPMETFDFEHSKSGSGKAYVQEWMRVSPIDPDLNSTGRYTNYEYGEGAHWAVNEKYLYARWPESYTEKQKAIKDLFNMSVAERGDIESNNLYINVLSGYFIDWHNADGYNYSLRPCVEEGVTQGNYLLVNWDYNNQGKGGNHTLYSYNINKYTYNLLTGALGTTDGLNQTGPWGLVVIDHIGTTQVKELGSSTTKTVSDDKSMNLVDLIMLNNFKFPLATKTTTLNIPPTTPDEGDPNQPGQGEGGQGGSAD